MNARRQCCILSKFYIKPQLPVGASSAVSSCILSKFYIKPQQRVRHKIGHSCCILSKFYIKPQQCTLQHDSFCVVSYRNSTSNHNKLLNGRLAPKLYLIEILHQTTTRITSMMSLHQLYLIEILHQTTTLGSSFVTADVLYLIEILHQTTTALVSALSLLGLYLIEILHQTTTASIDFSTPEKLYLIEILHQTTTFGPTSTRFASCILSKFYIKPQHLHETYCAYHVVSYRNSTSNHNIFRTFPFGVCVVSYRNSTSNHNKMCRG